MRPYCARMRRRHLLLGLLVTALLPAACGEDDPRGGAAGADVTVLAAASLTGAFEEIAVAFEREHEGTAVDLSFDGSARLATAIVEGAPADVFASADPPNLDRVRAADLLTGDPVVFATNALQIVVAEGNPLGIDSLDDLLGPDVTLSLCDAAVPCGAYAAQAFDRAGLVPPPAGDQDDVKGVLTQVQLGEADAGIVYVTDVLAADDVEGVGLDADQQVVATYPAGVLADAADPEGAVAFLDFLRGEEARSILEDFGFGLP